MAGEGNESGRSELVRLLTGDTRSLERLSAGERIRVETPFRYPGRRGAVFVHLSAVTVPGQAGETAEGLARPVRISDGGDVIKSLDEQGMDLSVDMILSKTVFHAVNQQQGGIIEAGEICLDSTAEQISADLWRYLQLVVEILGLRHSKYKDALVRLSRRQDAPDLIGWEGR